MLASGSVSGFLLKGTRPAEPGVPDQLTLFLPGGRGLGGRNVIKFDKTYSVNDDNLSDTRPLRTRRKPKNASHNGLKVFL